MRVKAPMEVTGPNSILNKVFLPDSPLHRYGQQFVLQDELTGEVLTNVLYKIYQDDRLVIKGRTDQNGLTHYVTTTNPENIRIEIDTKE